MTVSNVCLYWQAIIHVHMRGMNIMYSFRGGGIHTDVISVAFPLNLWCCHVYLVDSSGWMKGRITIKCMIMFFCFLGGWDFSNFNDYKSWDLTYLLLTYLAFNSNVIHLYLLNNLCVYDRLRAVNRAKQDESFWILRQITSVAEDLGQPKATKSQHRDVISTNQWCI